MMFKMSLLAILGMAATANAGGHIAASYEEAQMALAGQCMAEVCTSELITCMSGRARRAAHAAEETDDGYEAVMLAGLTECLGEACANHVIACQKEQGYDDAIGYQEWNEGFDACIAESNECDSMDNVEASLKECGYWGSGSLPGSGSLSAQDCGSYFQGTMDGSIATPESTEEAIAGGGAEAGYLFECYVAKCVSEPTDDAYGYAGEATSEEELVIEHLKEASAFCVMATKMEGLWAEHNEHVSTNCLPICTAHQNHKFESCTQFDAACMEQATAAYADGSWGYGGDDDRDYFEVYAEQFEFLKKCPDFHLDGFFACAATNGEHDGYDDDAWRGRRGGHAASYEEAQMALAGQCMAEVCDSELNTCMSGRARRAAHAAEETDDGYGAVMLAGLTECLGEACANHVVDCQKEAGYDDATGYQEWISEFDGCIAESNECGSLDNVEASLKECGMWGSGYGGADDDDDRDCSEVCADGRLYDDDYDFDYDDDYSASDVCDFYEAAVVAAKANCEASGNCAVVDAAIAEAAAEQAAAAAAPTTTTTVAAAKATVATTAKATVATTAKATVAATTAKATVVDKGPLANLADMTKEITANEELCKAANAAAATLAETSPADVDALLKAAGDVDVDALLAECQARCANVPAGSTQDICNTSCDQLQDGERHARADHAVDYCELVADAVQALVDACNRDGADEDDCAAVAALAEKFTPSTDETELDGSSATAVSVGAATLFVVIATMVV